MTWKIWCLTLSTTLSNFALAVYLVTIGLLLFEASNTVEGYVAYMVAEHLSMALIGIWVGQSLDRWAAERVLAVGLLVYALVPVLLLAAPDEALAEYGILLPVLTGILFSLGKGIYRPALFTIANRIVPDGQLHRLNGMQTTAMQVGQISGGVSVALLVSVADLDVALALSAGGWICAAFLGSLATSRGTKNRLAQSKPKEEAVASWRGVLHHLAQAPGQLSLVLLAPVEYLTLAAMNLSLAPIVAFTFGGDMAWAGWLSTAFSVSALAAAILSTVLKTSAWSQRLIGLVLQLLGWAGLSFATNSPEVLAAFGCLGLGMGLGFTAAISLQQLSANRSMHGRIAVIRSTVVALFLVLALPFLQPLIVVDIAAFASACAAVLGLAILIARFSSRLALRDTCASSFSKQLVPSSDAISHKGKNNG